MGTYGNVCLAIMLGAITIFIVGAVIFLGFAAYKEIKDWGKSRAENVQPDTKNMQPPYVRLYACSDGAVFDNEDMAKSHEASLKSKQSMN